MMKIHEVKEVKDLYEKVTVGEIRKSLDLFDDTDEMWVSMILIPKVDIKSEEKRCL